MHDTLTRAFTHWLSVDPPILYTCNWYPQQSMPLAATPLTHVWLPGRKLTRVGAIAQYQRLCELFPHWEHIIGITDRRQLPLIDDGRMMFFHDQFMVDPDSWPLYENAPQYYDAVMQAAAVPWKRHYLAAKTSRMLGVIYRHDDSAATEAYIKRLPKVLPKAMFAQPLGERQSQHNLAWLLNQSRSGLILSPAEGGCRAVAEYQLCGMPVVTTRHEGGRMELTDAAHMQIVPANEDAIAAAVQEFVVAGLDRQVVRDTFIRRQKQARDVAAAELGTTLTWPTTPGLPYLRMQEVTIPNDES